ncbi:hypothetical protein Cni_G10168 [Canna indica]|uniref:TCP domain-containing protein n=1 Tax=Canna indica TaxID=4628 RepID=A0AAQ3K3X5_9LILI|nr:hypothetical protein Cni_G10168 [Canna indica]
MMIERSTSGGAFCSKPNQHQDPATYITDDYYKAQASSKPWSTSPLLKNPRIVRVSRSLGSKDRHSKVRTIRGLRDRRIRLSVQTAIQLYDLQDKLGLSQPSKVVEWLICAARHEIDKLPPLEMVLQGLLLRTQFSQSVAPPPPHPPADSQMTELAQAYHNDGARDAINGDYGELHSNRAPEVVMRGKEKDPISYGNPYCYYQLGPRNEVSMASSLQYKYAQMASSASQVDDANLISPNLMVLQQNGMKRFTRDQYESYNIPNTGH